MTKLHTDRSYENQLRGLKEQLLLMAAHVEEMITSSVRALAERDATLARDTIAMDAKVNKLEIDTDELCLVILAKRQPMASDLRFITLALKMVTDLERIGDLAVNISERAIDLSKDTPIHSYEDIHKMGGIVRGLVHDAIDAFVEKNPTLARAVIERDDEVDELYERVFHQIVDVMRNEPTTMHRGIHFLSVAKWLERIADHSTNLAEQVVFMVKGQDIRHEGKLGEREASPVSYETASEPAS